MDAEPLARREVDAAALARAFPPRLLHPNKAYAHELIVSARTPRGTLAIARWPELALPDRLIAGGGGEVVERRDPFVYEDAPPGSVRWHVNFAHAELFCAYGGPALAQDELQVLEHPILGSVREALLAEPEGSALRPKTVEDDAPTPVLIRGAERWARFDTSLYGHRFRSASPEAIRDAITRLDPPGVTNLIAMEALPGGQGAYGADEIEYTLATAYSGFRASVLESRRDGDLDVIVHTGFWGCGAYGGNRVLMALLQLVAARLADVDELVFHCPGPDDPDALSDARAHLAELTESSIDVPALVAAIERLGFLWGTSDGT